MSHLCLYLIRPVILLEFLLRSILLIVLLVMSLSMDVQVLLLIVKVLLSILPVIPLTVDLLLYLLFCRLVFLALVFINTLFTLIMTRQKVKLSGYIKRKFDNAEVAALIDDLDLVPSFLITPSLVEMYRNELRERWLHHEFNKENVELAVAYTVELLSSEYGKKMIQYYRELFNMRLPFNR